MSHSITTDLIFNYDECDLITINLTQLSSKFVSDKTNTLSLSNFSTSCFDFDFQKYKRLKP